MLVNLNEANKKVELGTLNPGDIFKAKDIEFIFLDTTEDGNVAVIQKDAYDDCPDRIKFDSYRNNYAESEIRKILNTVYLETYKAEFGTGSIIEHEVDLTALDGLTDYGRTKDKVSLMTYDSFRKYAEILKKHNIDTIWWLATPWSTPTHGYPYGICCIKSGGSVGYCGCRDFSLGVRPFLILKSSILVSCIEDK